MPAISGSRGRALFDRQYALDYMYGPFRPRGANSEWQIRVEGDPTPEWENSGDPRRLGYIGFDPIFFSKFSISDNDVSASRGVFKQDI
jgi:hypothetical protein